MAVFFVLVFVPFLIQLPRGAGYDIEPKNKKNGELLFFFVFLTILLMFRHESVGNDTKNYISYFRTFSNKSWKSLTSESWEVGFAYFNKIVSLFSKNAQVFFAITAILTTYMIYPTYKRLCIDSTLTIVLFVNMSTFIMMFSGIRQMLAIAIGFLAYEFTRKKRLIPYALMVALAMMFHTSAFMLILMYPVYHLKLTKKSLIAVVPILCLIFVFNEPIFTFLAEYLEKYTRFGAELSSTGAYTVLILFAMFVVFSFVIPDEKIMDTETLGLRNFMVLTLALQMFAPLHTLAMRMNYYYIIFIPLLIPKIIQYRKKDMHQIALLARPIMVAFFLGYFFYSAYTSDNNLHVFPYKFFWEKTVWK